ncbi:MAG: GNAT family N-acetyltransferase [Lachnospiraceae bacterium]|nr:GNAT family N-acetyltransferase [Lachnospiraceae bacterium]
MSDMIIRKATNDDKTELRKLYLALEEDGVRYQPEHFVIGVRTDEFFQSIFDADNQDILVADIDGVAVGFVHVMILQQKKVSCLKPQSVVYMQDLCVSEDKRNNGIGARLVRAAKDYGKEHGVDFIRTQVFPGNVDGMRFYERNGFCEMMKTIECQSLD